MTTRRRGWPSRSARRSPRTTPCASCWSSWSRRMRSTGSTPGCIAKPTRPRTGCRCSSSASAFGRLLEMSNLLAVDSASFERPFLVTLELAGLAEAVGRQVPISDFHWARLQPWRELVAQFFQPQERLGFLRGINAVGVDYAGEGRGNRVAAAL